MSFQCEIKDQPTQPVLSIRSQTSIQDLPQVLGRSFGDVGQYLGELHEQPAGPPFAAYFNMDMQNLDIEVGFPVAARLPGKGNIQASEIPAGKIAACLYTGPYSEIEPAYTALTQYVAESGHEVSGVAYEMYLNDPTQTPPQELQTLIMFPLKAAA